MPNTLAEVGEQREAEDRQRDRALEREEERAGSDTGRKQKGRFTLVEAKKDPRERKRSAVLCTPGQIKEDMTKKCHLTKRPK